MERRRSHTVWKRNRKKEKKKRKKFTSFFKKNLLETT